MLTSGGDASGMNAAGRLGGAAVEALLDDRKSIMLEIMNDRIAHVPFNRAIKNDKKLNRALLNLVDILSALGLDK